ncbi:MAG TPA: LytTR family DNA-binding domain-containing protein [Thermoanaerobaculia bacterium]|nr:LytTR family DNA-binding domain-containing protein [Thermoanaerobaculia bacterium]
MAICTLVVDDESLARKRLRKLLRSWDDVAVNGEAASGDEALRLIQEQRPDLVFLDVQMPRLNGFDVVRRIPEETRPLIIFVTAYEQYALDAFRASAVQYLLKPVERQRLQSAMTRVRELIAARSNPSLSDFLDRLQKRTSYMQHVVVKAKGCTRLLHVEEIDWFESAGNYVRLHVRGERFLLRQTMSGLEQKLDPQQFARIHRTAIVNLRSIRDVKAASHGDHLLLLHGDTQLLLSRVYRERLHLPYSAQ